MTARFISNNGTREVSDREFFASWFGHPPKSREQRDAEHRAEVERYIAMIEAGGGWSTPPAYRSECERVIAERADLEPRKRPDGRWEVAA